MGTVPLARTFAASEIETAAYLNSLSAAVNFLLNPPRVLAWQNAGSTLTNNTWTVVPLDSEDYDTDGMHNPALNNSRLTASTSGLYLVQGQINFGTNGSGVRQMAIGVNGSALYPAYQTGAASSANVLQVTKEVYLAAGDYVEMFGFQNSGANQSTGAGSDRFVWLSARWVAES